MAKLDENGHEILDQTPIALPVGFQHPPPLIEQIRRMIRVEMSEAAAASGAETFDEADDFDVGDDYDPKSNYELDEEADSLPKWKDDEQKKAALEAFEAELKKREEALEAKEEKEYRMRRRKSAPVTKEKSDVGSSGEKA